MRFFMQKNGLMFGIPTWLANVKTLQWRQKITSTYADNLPVVDTNLSSHYHEKLEDNWQSLITAGLKLSHWAFELSVSLNSTVRQTIFLGYSQLNILCGIVTTQLPHGVWKEFCLPSTLEKQNAVQKYLHLWSVCRWRYCSQIDLPKQWNAGHVGVPNQSCVSSTLFLCKHFCSHTFAWLLDM